VQTDIYRTGTLSKHDINSIMLPNIGSLFFGRYTVPHNIISIQMSQNSNNISFSLPIKQLRHMAAIKHTHHNKGSLVGQEGQLPMKQLRQTAIRHTHQNKGALGGQEGQKKQLLTNSLQSLNVTWTVQDANDWQREQDSCVSC